MRTGSGKVAERGVSSLFQFLLDRQCGATDVPTRPKTDPGLRVQLSWRKSPEQLVLGESVVGRSRKSGKRYSGRSVLALTPVFQRRRGRSGIGLVVETPRTTRNRRSTIKGEKCKCLPGRVDRGREDLMLHFV